MACFWEFCKHKNIKYLWEIHTITFFKITWDTFNCWPIGMVIVCRLLSSCVFFSPTTRPILTKCLWSSCTLKSYDKGKISKIVNFMTPRIEVVGWVCHISGTGKMLNFFTYLLLYSWAKEWWPNHKRQESDDCLSCDSGSWTELLMGRCLCYVIMTAIFDPKIFIFVITTWKLHRWNKQVWC